MRRKREIVEGACRALSRYAHDDQYQFLHDRISELFTDLLSADMKHLESGRIKRVGLAAKWCPSLDSSFDKATLICESIAHKLFTIQFLIMQPSLISTMLTVYGPVYARRFLPL
jgi:Domain of unknown function (DUF2828)